MPTHYPAPHPAAPLLKTLGGAEASRAGRAGAAGDTNTKGRRLGGAGFRRLSDGSYPMQTI